MSLIIKLLCLSFLTLSCQNEERIANPPPKKQTPFFATSEVVATLNALVAIIDWPKETLEHQKNLSVDLETARKLMLPLHPLWDEKIAEVAYEMPSWDEKKIKNVVNGCAKKCECDFYKEVLDKNPTLIDSSPGLKVLGEFKFDRTKETLFQCLREMPSVQKLLQHLQVEKKNYEAEST